MDFKESCFLAWSTSIADIIVFRKICIIVIFYLVSEVIFITNTAEKCQILGKEGKINSFVLCCLLQIIPSCNKWTRKVMSLSHWKRNGRRRGVHQHISSGNWTEPRLVSKEKQAKRKLTKDRNGSGWRFWENCKNLPMHPCGTSFCTVAQNTTKLVITGFCFSNLSPSLSFLQLPRSDIEVACSSWEKLF